ncbi:regulator of polyketide synthase expression [Mycobacteroides abscessus subsp. massiliense]|nr:regulator of polyketide synthase expression [Mycobacteroides abscessus subsp. massiliense]
MRWWHELGPADILVPTLQPRSALSLDDDVRSLLGPDAIDWTHALAVELTRDYVEVSLPELARSADFKLALQISVEANLQAVLLTLGGNRSDVEPPQEALLYADEAVARQVPLVVVLRGYQLAVEHWLRWCAPVIARHADAADQADELQLAVSVAVRYIDRLSDNIIVEYERELQRRATSGAASRAALVGALLDGDAVDVDDASHLLHYPLQGTHMALALRIRGAGTNQAEILQSEARAFAASVGATGLLTLSTGLTTLDAWVALQEYPEEPNIAPHEHVNIGVGTPLAGIGGFIQSHREAQRALEIFDMATPGRLDSITYYDRLRLISLMTQNIADLRRFVTVTLGNLAGTDERSRELRETLLTFLQANRSYTAVARSCHLHKNTVVQRITRASELSGLDTTQDLDIHVALMAVDLLGEDLLADT